VDPPGISNPLIYVNIFDIFYGGKSYFIGTTLAPDDSKNFT